MKRLMLVIVLMALAVPAWANHPPTSDSGEDIPNIGEAMNQESYWEDYFGGDGWACTKFEGHNGSIPASYEAAVVKDGSLFVRVYLDPPAQVIGPPNPNEAHPNRRHEAPFSWVMKCDYTEPPVEELPPTVTVTCETLTVDAAEGVEWVVWIGDGQVEGEGTESFQAIPGWFYAVTYNDEVIAEGVFEECSTTTTTPPSTSTSSTSPTETTTPPPTDSTTTLPPESSSTTTPESTSTTTPAPTVTASTPPSTLPFTGSEDVPLAVAGLALLGLGAAVLRGRKCDTD